MPQTLDQKRAKHAWDVVGKVKKFPDKDDKADFGTQLKKLPSRILASGLGQSLVFLKSKSKTKKNEEKPGYVALINALADWVHQMRPVPQGQKPDLLDRIIKGDSDFLRWATAETLAYLQWLVRLADAEGIKPGEE